MKGTPDFPQCGFSAQTVAALRACGADFAHVNIFEDPELREALKSYSKWPTYPQLYVNGELLGGCDIALEMYPAAVSCRSCCEAGAGAVGNLHLPLVCRSAKGGPPSISATFKLSSAMRRAATLVNRLELIADVAEKIGRPFRVVGGRMCRRRIPFETRRRQRARQHRLPEGDAR